jgi:hypothetical protein
MVGSPLPHGHVGDHMINELGREGAHAAAPARRAEPPPLARERHDHLVLAARAAHVDAPVLQEAAAQVGPQLSGHEVRQAATLVPGGAREEGVEALGNIRLQEALGNIRRQGSLTRAVRRAAGGAPGSPAVLGGRQTPRGAAAALAVAAAQAIRHVVEGCVRGVSVVIQ